MMRITQTVPRPAALAAGLLALCLFAGCESPMVRQQRLVSKPNMQFSDSALFAYSSRISSQLEPGAAISGGAQNSGCSSCR